MTGKEWEWSKSENERKLHALQVQIKNALAEVNELVPAGQGFPESEEFKGIVAETAKFVTGRAAGFEEVLRLVVNEPGRGDLLALAAKAPGAAGRR